MRSLRGQAPWNFLLQTYLLEHSSVSDRCDGAALASWPARLVSCQHRCLPCSALDRAVDSTFVGRTRTFETRARALLARLRRRQRAVGLPTWHTARQRPRERSTTPNPTTPDRLRPQVIPSRRSG